MTDSVVDVAIVGAGVAGLTCAQRLHQAGYRVVVVEKSRGLGGRMATRRLHGTHADHGVCYLTPKHQPFKALLDRLVEQGILKTWTETIHQLDSQGRVSVLADRSPCYASPTGISAIARAISINLTIWLNQRITQIEAVETGWRLRCEETSIAQTPDLVAKALVMAIPAPQAIVLLQPLGLESYVDQLKAVEFAPSISAIALYPQSRQSEAEALSFQGIVGSPGLDLSWIGFDSSKQSQPSQPVFVIQSSAAFAHQFFEAANIQAVGENLLAQAAHVTAPWLAKPDVLQVHRWRYAFPTTPLSQPFLVAPTDSPLVCTGDWCGGNRVESAFQSGFSTADWLNAQLTHN
ncbi:NAD(P)/FAD-dependent oxidoreductase [Myxacorys almedinensis]|uniref:FAD-dependent oxidoreductase n=1 Tax=Myxacorys almedinensis A TaxID=2690445 RepID=A0A8J8CLL8_9CYAN|nr:FAD-dependent oxidoreductase [Myxacorys almedinensis]NDJ19806.1 FAD-dependent oxidoreductase [Myxacorys almedinensis A]